MKRVTTTVLREMKQKSEKIVSLTAYDYTFARLLDRAGVDVVLVGDSLGNVVQGHESTLPVRVEDMIYHSRCVARGCERALLMVDMPFMSYQQNPEQALSNAGRLMQEGSAHMVKLEGGAPMVETVRFLVERGIPVCAHLGLTPQAVHQLGGYRVQGREERAAEQMRRDAHAMQEAGASALLLEAIPATLAKELTAELQIPTIGIGAGRDCDGQVLVLHDMLGLSERAPKFVRNFLQGHDSIETAVRAYVAAVRAGEFPGSEHTFH